MLSQLSTLCPLDFGEFVQRAKEGKENEKKAIAFLVFRVVMVPIFLSSSGQLFCHVAFSYWLSIKRNWELQFPASALHFSEKIKL